MQLSHLTFVALDLETTGLDTTRDRIIEVAAVRFGLEYDGERYTAVNLEERSMLIDPGIEITPEISMITGITDSMVHGKSRWEEVRERVADFIGKGNIIVGHNVLFDIEVLRHHGIDLTGQTNSNPPTPLVMGASEAVKKLESKHPFISPLEGEPQTNESNIPRSSPANQLTSQSTTIIDTFELSEILAQDVESLNLGFLANRYGISLPGEHRALTDVKMSIGLLEKFLTDIRCQSKVKQSMISSLGSHDQEGIISTIIHICDIEREQDYTIHIDTTLSSSSSEESSTKNHSEENNLEIVSLSGYAEEEIDLIKNHLTKHSQIDLVLQGKKQKEWIHTKLRTIGIKTAEIHSARSYICLSRLQHRLNDSTSWSRKYLILILKLLFWLEDTKTGHLSELKYYGNEYEMLEEFREREPTGNYFIDRAIEETKNAQVTLIDAYEIFHHTIPTTVSGNTTLIREVEDLENTVRSALSRDISFYQLYRSLEKIKTHAHTSDLETMIGHFEMIEGLISTTATRPPGDNAFPPGDYGETYHLTQEDIWHRGHKWFPILMRSIRSLWSDYIGSISDSDRYEYMVEIGYIEDCISHLATIIEIKNTNLSSILHISRSGTTLHIIPRNIKSTIEKYLSSLGRRVIAYGNGISGPIMRGFLERECVTHFSLAPHSTSPKDDTILLSDIARYQENVQKLFQKHEKSGNIQILLTTNLKQVKELGSELMRRYSESDTLVFVQGISGGKGKILANILKSDSKMILVGLIDTWTDEYALWEKALGIHIIKLPFDPPTDARFLARTVGMRDNFSMYSIPITLKKMNTLIARIHQSGLREKIYCYDLRLSETLWGREIYKELI